MEFLIDRKFWNLVIKKLRPFTKKTFDVHLMISPVDSYIKQYSEAGSDIITFHPEATNDTAHTISLIRKYKKKVGVSLNPQTPIDLVKDFLDKIDLVLVMSVHPGFGGQKFMPEVLDKIEDLSKLKKEKKLTFDIEVDGGIDFDNSKLVKKAGANILVSGTTIFKNNNGDIKKNIDVLRTG